MTCGLFLILHRVLCVLAIDPGTSTECTETPVCDESGRYNQFPRLDREDYALWAMNMEVAMEGAEFWEAVDPGGNEYAKGGAKYRKDHQALTAIYSVVPKDVMQHL